MHLLKAKKAIPPNLAKPKSNQDHFLLQPNFSLFIFYAFVTIPHQDCTKTDNFTYSPILLPRQKKANPPNLARPKPNQDQFLLQPNFSLFIFDAFVTIPHQDCTNTDNFTYSPSLLPRQNKANPPNLAKPKPNQDQLILQPNFSLLIFDAFVTIPHQDCTKTLTSLIHQFCYQGNKNPIHRTWLSQNPTKINSFCNQTFHTSFLMHLWQFRTKIAQKP